MSRILWKALSARLLSARPIRRSIIRALPMLRKWPRRVWFERYHALVAGAKPLRLASTRFGARMWCNLDDSIGMRIFHFGLWEPAVSRAIGKMLRPGDTFVDVGANIGYDTLLGAALVGPSGKVVAIEPSPRIARLLRTNLKLNRFTNVRIAECAASDRDRTVRLYGGENENLGRTSTLALAGLVAEGEVPARPLDLILTEEERRTTSLIKIDIEGGESAVLRRLLDTLDLYRPDLRILVEISPDEGGVALAAAFSVFLARGFRAYAVENVYDILAYLPPRPAWPPVEIFELPPLQTDVLFARGPLPR